MSSPTVFSSEDLVELCGAAVEPTRLRILALLAESELTAGEITDILRQSQPRVSRHLKVLVDAELVHRTPEGAFAFFRLARDARPAALAQTLLSLVDPADRTVRTDAERLTALRSGRNASSEAFFEANAAEWERLRQLHVADDRVEEAIVGIVAERAPASVLDLGTGTGRMLQLLGPKVSKGVGIDSSPKMLAIARANLEQAGLRHCTVRHGDIADLGYGDASFDLVIIHQVLHLVDDPQRVIDEAARVLSAGGTMLVVDFAPHDHEFLRTSQAHRRLGFSRDVIAGWMNEAGLRHGDHETLVAERADGISISLWTARDRRPTRPLRRMEETLA